MICKMSGIDFEGLGTSGLLSQSVPGCRRELMAHSTARLGVPAWESRVAINSAITRKRSGVVGLSPTRQGGTARLDSQLGIQDADPVDSNPTACSSVAQFLVCNLELVLCTPIVFMSLADS